MYEGAGYSRLLPIIVLLSSRGASSKDGQSVCQPGIEFWSSESGRCESCTVCEPAFTISPCAVHRDAICGPFSALELNLSFLSATTPRAYIPTDTENQKNFEKQNWMPWDWQTGALILAVCACVVFFIVAACSAIFYTRDWRKMKKNFDRASLEEISTRLNMMVKAELAELASGAPMNPGDPEMRCQYLEKLLDRKREPVTVAWPEARSNLYIEEGETPPSQHTHIARIHRNIENILKNSKR